MRWHLSKVPRTRILVIGVISSKSLIKGKKILFELAGIRVIRVRVNRRSKNDWKVGWKPPPPPPQKKIGLSLVRVSGEFELSGFYCIIIILIILITITIIIIIIKIITMIIIMKIMIMIRSSNSNNVKVRSKVLWCTRFFLLLFFLCW